MNNSLVHCFNFSEKNVKLKYFGRIGAPHTTPLGGRFVKMSSSNTKSAIYWIVDTNGLSVAMKPFHMGPNAYQLAMEQEYTTSQGMAFLASEAVRSNPDYGVRIPGTRAWFVMIPPWETQIPSLDSSVAVKNTKQFVLLDGSGRAHMVHDGNTLLKAVAKYDPSAAPAVRVSWNRDHCLWCTQPRGTPEEISAQRLRIAILAFRVLTLSAEMEQKMLPRVAQKIHDHIVGGLPKWRALYDSLPRQPPVSIEIVTSSSPEISRRCPMMV